MTMIRTQLAVSAGLVCAVIAGWSASGRAVTSPGSSAVVQRLVDAYPQHVRAGADGTVAVRGVTLRVGSGTSGSIEERMERADLVDQLSMAYPAGCPLVPPAAGADPGRLRNEAFFKAMYGTTAAAVRANVVSVPWFDSTLSVTTINGVDKRLARVAEKLAGDQSLRRYLVAPGGAFVWRPIAGTSVQSAHSFGIAVDINTAYSDYWRWKNTSTVVAYKNRIPCRIAEAFESEGFIWGAKWWHFDTMHFEYRPELLA